MSQLNSRQEKERTGTMYNSGDGDYFGDVINNSSNSGSSSPDSNTAPSAGGNQPSPENVSNSFSDTLSSLREQAESIQASISDQADQLARDDKANDPETGITASSATTREAESDVAAQIERLSAPSPNYEAAQRASQNFQEQLQAQYDELDQQRQRRRDSIERDYDQQEAQLEDRQEREEASNRSSLIRAGGYLGESASSIGALNNLSKTHQNEINVLEQKKQSAITQAEEAYSQQQTQVAKQMAQEATRIEQEQQRRQQQFFNNSLQVLSTKSQQETREAQNQTRKLQNAETRASNIAPEIARQIGSLDVAPEDMNETIAGYAEKYNIDETILRGKVKAKVQEQSVNDLSMQMNDLQRQQLENKIGQDEIIGSQIYQRDDGQYVYEAITRSDDGSTNRITQDMGTGYLSGSGSGSGDSEYGYGGLSEDQAVTFNDEARRTLASSGLSGAMISEIQNDLNARGIDYVMDNPDLTSPEKQAIRNALDTTGLESPDNDTSREPISEDDFLQIAEDYAIQNNVIERDKSGADSRDDNSLLPFTKGNVSDAEIKERKEEIRVKVNTLIENAGYTRKQALKELVF